MPVLGRMPLRIAFITPSMNATPLSDECNSVERPNPECITRHERLWVGWLRGSASAEHVQGTPTYSHISTSLLSIRRQTGDEQLGSAVGAVGYVIGSGN